MSKQEQKHTPGPWVFYADLPSVEPNWHIVTTANRLRVLANVHIEPGNSADLANARLIAAAPELLAELRRDLAFVREMKAALRAIGLGDTVQFTQCEMREQAVVAAIAKAGGAA